VSAVSDAGRTARAASAADAARPLDADVKRVLVDNHRHFLRFLERRIGRRDVAEDLLQDAFARGLDKVDTLRDGEAAVSWFYRTLRNAAVDHARRARVRHQALVQLAAELEGSAGPPDSLHDEACRCITRLAATLKPAYADALRRIEIDGISVVRFAEEQGISKSNAAVRVFRAREALRRQLAVSCGTCAEHGCLACTCGALEDATAGRGREPA
jgi:RNA polymerase sigma factor (sigma-70 family)